MPFDGDGVVLVDDVVDVLRIPPVAEVLFAQVEAEPGLHAVGLRRVEQVVHRLLAAGLVDGARPGGRRAPAVDGVGGSVRAGHRGDARGVEGVVAGGRAVGPRVPRDVGLALVGDGPLVEDHLGAEVGHLLHPGVPFGLAAEALVVGRGVAQLGLDEEAVDARLAGVEGGGRQGRGEEKRFRNAELRHRHCLRRKGPIGKIPQNPGERNVFFGYAPRFSVYISPCKRDSAR